MEVFAIIASIIFLLSLIGFIYYCIKGGNLIIGLLVTTALWLLIGFMSALWSGISSGDIHNFTTAWNAVVKSLNMVVSDGPIGYGTTTTVIIFASWFGRVIVDTGIAKALIKRVVELSGDRQVVTVVLISLISALLFTSIFGAGSVMAIGAIILPILLTIGVSKKVAVGSFLLSVAAGMYVNSGYTIQFSEHNLFSAIFAEEGFGTKFTAFGWTAFAIHVVVMVGFILFNLYVAKDRLKSWAVSDEGFAGNPEAEVKGIAFIVPFIPIILALGVAIANMFLPSNAQLGGFAAITSFMIGIILGLALTGNFKTYKKAVESSQKTLFNGISDVALLIGLLLVLNMFSTAASKFAAPLFEMALGGSLDWVANNPIIILVVFMVLAPFALFRGPFMIWGSGIALASVLAAFIPAASPLLLILFYVQPVAIVASSCPTQSWGMWSLAYAKYEANTYIKTNIPWAWIICVANLLMAYLILM